MVISLSGWLGPEQSCGHTWKMSEALSGRRFCPCPHVLARCSVSSDGLRLPGLRRWCTKQPMWWQWTSVSESSGDTVASARKLSMSQKPMHSSSAKKDVILPTGRLVSLSSLICYHCPRTHLYFRSSVISLWLSPSVFRWFCTSKGKDKNPRKNPQTKTW